MTQKEPEEGLASEAEQKVAEPEDIEASRQALAEEKTKAEGYLANWQRVQADFINYKRRTEQEKEEIGDFARAMLTLNFIPILDDLERALTSIPPHLAELSWVDGIQLIEHKLRTSLETQGLSQIKGLGEPFDPNLHEAAMYGRGKEGIVIEELQKGYKFHNRIIRPAKVVVGNGEEEEEKKEE